MDGESYNVGAVGSLRRCRDAAKTARQVMEHTEQTLLVGDLASEFAFSMGCKNESLTSEKSEAIQQAWKKNRRQR